MTQNDPHDALIILGYVSWGNIVFEKNFLGPPSLSPASPISRQSQTFGPLATTARPRTMTSLALSMARAASLAQACEHKRKGLPLQLRTGSCPHAFTSPPLHPVSRPLATAQDGAAFTFNIVQSARDGGN